MRAIGRIALLSAALPLMLAAAARPAVRDDPRALGPGERLLPPPPNRQPPLREDTYTAKRKAKARAKRGW